MRRARGHRRIWSALIAVIGLLTALAVTGVAAPSSGASTYTPKATGELDCNNDSPVQRAVRPSNLCTDIRGFSNINNANNWNGRFYDNGVYIGHDEPDVTYLSSAPGSGNSVAWSETLGSNPTAAPTVSTPGSDVSHWFELSPAPWFSMAMCDSNSYPQLPCTPESDKNAPSCPNAFNCGQRVYPGGGSAFMEMQFYPPGFAPFDDAVSCDNTHWCSALTIDSLECTYNFAQCNTHCEEPINFAFVQTNGVPPGPPNPQNADLATFTANSNTLLMNPGDRVTVRMGDSPVPGGHGQMAFKVTVDDLTTNQVGYMQASAQNGFQNTSIVDCSGTPFNFQPEYSTAKAGNIIPWAALQTNISTEFETGHFEPCTSVTEPGQLTLAPGVTDTYYNECHGPYETAAPGGDGSGQPEAGDALCYKQGDTHGVLNTAPDTITGCQDNLFQNGDLDFDGTPYWREWPTGPAPTATLPASFVQKLPRSAGRPYQSFFFQTDLALSESTCSGKTTAGCTVPPDGPGAFYPYWTTIGSSGCTLEFGNVSTGQNANTYGGDAQYGTDQIGTIGYPEFEGPILPVTCA